MEMLVLKLWDYWALISIIFIGIPHGALDGAISITLGYSKKLKLQLAFISMYIFIAFVVIMFWIYFPEARYVFANYDVFNRQNDAERRTFEDIFWKRMFNSYAYKKSNVYDRESKGFLKGIDVLLEADKIKNELFVMEHDLWSY